MPQGRPARWSFGVLCAAGWLLLGCDNGVGIPIRAVGAASAGGDSEQPQPQPGVGGDSGVDFLGPGVPDTPHCAAVAAWPADAAQQEFEMSIALNAVRAGSRGCDGSGSGGPVPGSSLEPSAELTCSARLHVLDMVTHDFFSQVNLQGEGPEARIAAAGYVFVRAGEDIASGDVQPVAQALVANGGQDCENIVSPAFTDLGIGRRGNLWVIDFGAR